MSTEDQNLDVQIHALKEAECESAKEVAKTFGVNRSTIYRATAAP
jgi:DNA invertase Pin-like site-specific DNA recombinase